PVTDVRRLLICTSVTLVRLLVCTPITLLRRLLACIRTVRRPLVCIGSTRLLTCSPGTCIRGLLTCTTTNHPCVIPIGENRVASKGNVAGERGRRRENGRIYHRTGRSRPGGNSTAARGGSRVDLPDDFALFSRSRGTGPGI